MTTSTPQLNVKKLRNSLQDRQIPMKPTLKTRQNSKNRYIHITASVTIYNVQGNPNPTSKRSMQWNEDGTVDFGPFFTGYRVEKVGFDVVELVVIKELLVSTIRQKAVIGREVYDLVMECLDDNDLEWRFDIK